MALLLQSDDCSIFMEFRNRSSKQEILPGVNFGFYEGIPQHFLVNFVLFLALIIVFSLLRKAACNYGRSALIHHTDVKEDKPPDDTAVEEESYKREASGDKPGKSDKTDPAIILDIDNRGFFTWIITTFRLTDDQIRAKSGPDAVYYLSFQRHLLLIAYSVLVLSLVIVFPLNLQGKTSDVSEFGSQSIKNLDESPKLLWVHLGVSILYLIITVVILRHFSKSLAIGRNPVRSRTVMIRKVATGNSISVVESHFKETFPNFEMDEVTFAYDIARVRKAEIRKKTAANARQYWEKYYEKSGKRPKMYPYMCGQLLCCLSICGTKPSDAIDYYREEEDRQNKIVEAERRRALANPLGIVFVTFRTISMAQRIVKAYRSGSNCCRRRPYSSFSGQLKTKQWIAKYAPLPEDLCWQNLATTRWYFKAVLFNAILIIFVVVIAPTPLTLVYFLSNYQDQQNTDRNGNFWDQFTKGIFSKTIPTLLVLTFVGIFPAIVSLSDEFVRFWTKTAENKSRMIKIYVFLLFAVIILPSAGLLGFGTYFIQWRWNFDCIFYTGYSIFFVNYVISSAFVGTTSELLRFPELLLYVIKLSLVRSSAEMATIRQHDLREFQFGIQYAWTMLNYTVFIVFSLVCPVIAPFGLMYIAIKHFVDRYNVYFAYAPCKVDKDVHVTAIKIVIVTMFVLQLILSTYFSIGHADSKKVLISASVFTFWITTAIFFGQVFCNKCSHVSPIIYQKMTEDDVKEEDVPIRKSSEDNSSTDVLSTSDLCSVSGVSGRYFPEILRPDVQAEIPAVLSQRNSTQNNADSARSSVSEEAEMMMDEP